MKRDSLILILAACISGCMVGPDYHRPPTPLPGSFAASPPATQPTAQVDVAQWWTSLNDPELNWLVQRAVQSNLDLQIAVARLQEARAQEYAAVGVALPDLEADGAVARGSGTDSVKGRIPSDLDAGEQSSKVTEVTEVVGADAVWNLDLFGGLRREIQAARYDVQAAADARNDVLVTLISDVALAYTDQREAELRLSIVNADIQAEQSSANLVETRYNRGFTNELDPELAERELGAVRAEVAPLEATIEQDQRRLAFLLGEYPGDLSAELNRTGLSAAPPGLPSLPARIEPGLPIDLLKRRPDIRQAERQLAAQTARIGVAVDALYPHVFISGALGVQGQGFGRTPLEGSFIGTIGPGAYWSLLDFGTLDALVEKQDYATRQALLNYQRTVLTAVEQADDAIRDYAAAQDQLTNLGDALNAAQRAVQIASQRYDRGFTNYLDVLDAQREYYALHDQYAVTQAQVVVQFIAIYKSLGGGWEQFRLPPPPRQPMPAIIAAVRGN
jgi:NodT family efflux transporter outer membrane factor (OMF) lipoprotein